MSAIVPTRATASDPASSAPSLDGLEVVDGPTAAECTYGAVATWTGLGVLDQRIVPHIQSPTHPESAALDDVADRYAARGELISDCVTAKHLVIHGDTSKLLDHPAKVSEMLRAYNRRTEGWNLRSSRRHGHARPLVAHASISA